MCRILAVFGRLSWARSHYPGLIAGLVGASFHDPHLSAIRGGGRAGHGDGWGRVSLLLGPGYESITYYRSMAPIYVDRPGPEPPVPGSPPPRDPYIFDLVHARAASTGMPVNIYSVQPFEFPTRTGSRFYLIHNGTVDKDGLAAQLEGGHGGLERYSDTYVMGLWLSERLEDRVEERVVRELKEYVATALNMGILLVAPGRVQLVVGSYYREPVDQARRRYYRLYAAQTGKGLIVASSTIVDFEDYKPGTIDSWVEVPNGTYYTVDVEVGGSGELRVSMSSFNI